MKIAPKAAATFLANPGHCRAVLFYGPDEGLMRERAADLRKTILGAGADPFAFTELEEASLLADTARLADELLMVSMLAPKRVLMVSGGDKLTAILKDASQHFHADIFLIITAGELSPRSSLRVWFEGAPNAAAVACYRDEVRDVESLVRQHFSAAGINANRDVVEYLAQQLGNDRYVTRQELEKLVTYAGVEKQLTLENVQDLVDYNRDTNLDDVVQAVADKNLKQLDAFLKLQQREGTMPTVYLRALMRYFNRLYWVHAQMNAGQSMEAAIASLKPKVFFKQEHAMRRHVQHWNISSIIKALGLMMAAELGAKTSDMPAAVLTHRKLMKITQIR